MSTSLLYHSFGIRGYEYIRTDYQGGATIFTIRQDPDDCRCSACGSRDVISRGHAERRFVTLPIGSRKTTVALPIPRVECRACGAVRQVRVPFADTRRSYTKSFERYVLELSRRMTIRDVAHHLDVGWDLVKDIQKRGATPSPSSSTSAPSPSTRSPWPRGTATSRWSWTWRAGRWSSSATARGPTR
jgi:transposase